MAHLINSMMFVGETPWHGLGVRLPQNATWKQTRDAVGFYEVEERELYAAGLGAALPDVKALVRGDTGEYLATVGRDYGVVQFGDMARAVVEAAGNVGAVFHTAGLLGNGKRGWLLGELPGGAIKVPGDKSEIRRFFLAYSGHDGNTPITLANVATRVVCNNTLGIALGEKNGARYSIRHNANAEQRVTEAGAAFSRLAKGYETFTRVAEEMASTGFSNTDMSAVFLDLMGNSLTAPATRKRAKIAELMDSGKGMDGIQGTAWGAFQAFTEYADHHAPIRNFHTSPQNTKAANLLATRLFSASMGNAVAFKHEALLAITSQVGIKIPALSRAA